MNAIITAERINNYNTLIVEPMEATKEWEDWDMECMHIDAVISEFNNVQIDRENRIEQAMKLLDKLNDLGFEGFGSDVWKWIMALPKPEELKNSEDHHPTEPK